MTQRTNAEAIETWGRMPEAALSAFDPEGDFGRRTMLNPELFRLLGDVAGLRVLDAGSGQGYLSRMLAARGASVVGVEPAEAMFSYAVARETELRQGVRYEQADLATLPDLGGSFDAVVSNVVLEAIHSGPQRCETASRRFAPAGCS